MEMADGDRFTPEQAEALSALRDGRNVFLSGNAGTGKSYVLNAFISDLKARNVDFLALAPTGIAALNLTDGSTIHRTLKIAPGVCAPDGPKGSRKVLDAAKVIIIDEISMCRIDLFDHVMGMISQSMTRNGAKQVVLVGDFFQLPPVVTERDSALLMKFYPGNLQGWCFKSRYWTGFDFEPHVLKTVVRQSDPDFIDNLNRARVGDASCLDYFNAHSKSSGAYARETEFFALDEAAVVGAFRELGPEEAAERDRIRAQAAARVQEAERHRREAECLFEYRFSCSPYSAMAYEAFHPELCERRVSKRRKQELVVYRLPDGSEPSGYAEMSVPADYADSSHVVPSVFISGTGGDRAWRDIDFDEAERKFAAAARRAAAFREGKPKLMQDEARRAAIRETRHRVCTAPILKSIKEIHR